MTKFSCAALLLLLCLVACRKEHSPQAEQKGERPKEFIACDCLPRTEKDSLTDYIKAEIDGVPVCFDANPALGDTFPNMLKWGYLLRDTARQYYDNLYMIRNARNSQWQAAMFFENTHAFTKTYPYDLPRANPEYCEIGSLQLNNRGHYTSCAWCPENDFNFSAPFFSTGLKMTATGFKDGVFEGVFSGTVRTGSGRTASVKNGRFRMRLVVFRMDHRIQ